MCKNTVKKSVINSISKIPPKQIQLETWSSHSVHTCIHHTGSKVWTAIQLFIHASGSQTDVTPERERERECTAWQHSCYQAEDSLSLSIKYQYHYLPLSTSSQISLLRHFWLVVHYQPLSSPDSTVKTVLIQISDTLSGTFQSDSTFKTVLIILLILYTPFSKNLWFLYLYHSWMALLLQTKF